MATYVALFQGLEIHVYPVLLTPAEISLRIFVKRIKRDLLQPNRDIVKTEYAGGATLHKLQSTPGSRDNRR
jgi:hypothetical protein